MSLPSPGYASRMELGIDARGRVTIPAEALRECGWSIGEKLQVEVTDEGVIRLWSKTAGTKTARLTPVVPAAA